MRHFIDSSETTVFCFIVENIIVLPHYYRETNLAPLELALLDFTRDIGEA